MELELGLKITRTREDVSSSVDFRFSKDPFGPLVLSQETDSRFIIIIHLKGFKKEGIEIEINKEGNRIIIRGRKPVEEMVLIRWMAWMKEVELRTFKKVFLIPDVVDLDKIKARFDDDDSTLTITMPKRVKGISGFKLEEEEEESVDSGDVSETQNIEEEFREMMEDKARESRVFEGEEKGLSGVLDEEETQIEDDDLEKIQHIDEQDKILKLAEEETVAQEELSDMNAETDDISLRKLLDIIEQEVMEKEVETKNEGTESRAVEEIEEPDELDRASKSNAMQKKTTDGDDDGLRKAQGIEEPERHNEEIKIQELVEEETGGQEEVPETETKAEEFESEKETVGQQEFAGSNTETENSILRKLPDILEQENNQDVMEQKVSQVETKSDDNNEQEPDERLDRTSDGGATEKKTTDNDGDGLRKFQGIEEPEGQSEGGKIQDIIEGKGGEEKLKREIKNGDPKEVLDAEMREGFTPDIERTRLVVDEVDKKHELVEKKKEEEEEKNAKIGTQSEDISLIKHQDIEEQQSKGHKTHDKREKIKELVEEKALEAETNTGNDTPKQKIKEIFQEETMKQLEEDKEKMVETGKTINDSGSSKVQGIEEPEGHSEGSKIQDIIEGTRGGEKKNTGKRDIKNGDLEEAVDEKMGEGFTPNIERTGVVGEDDIAETETKGEEFESVKPEADEVDKKHELVGKKEEEEENANVGMKLQEDKEQHSKGRKRQDGQENIKDKVEEKTPDAETYISNDVPKPVQEIKIPEVGTSEETGDEGSQEKEKKRVNLEVRNRESKEEVAGNMGVPNIAETETKPAEFESENLVADEVDKIHELVEKKKYDEEEENNDKVGTQSEDISLRKPQEIQEQQSQGHKRHDKHEKIKELVEEEKTPEAETNIGNETLKQVQERCEGKQNIKEEETKKQPKEHKEKMVETGKKINDAGSKKSQEISRQQGLDELERCEKESKLRGSVESKTNDEEKEEKEVADTETKEQESYRPKILEEEEKVQELAEEKKLFLKNRKLKEEEKIPEKKSEFGDDDVSRKVGDNQQRDSDAKEEVDAETETKAEKFEPHKLEPDEVDEIHELVEKKEGEEDNAKVGRQSEDRSFIKLQENEKQHSKGQERQKKTAETETNIPKPVPENQEAEVDTVWKTGNEEKEGKEKKKSAMMEIKNGYPKEEADATNGEGFAANIAETETKTEELESDEVDEMHGPVEKKEVEEDNAKVRRQSEESNLVKSLQETEEQHFQGQKPLNKQDKVKELLEEKTPAAETNIPKPVQVIEEPEVDTLETCGKKEIAETEAKEQESYRPKTLVELEKIQELAEEEVAEKKTEHGDDDHHISRKVGDNDQRDSYAKEVVAEMGEGFRPNISEAEKKAGEVDKIHELVDKKKEENDKVSKTSEDTSLKRLQEQKFQGPNQHNKQENIKDLVKEKPEADTNIANDVPKLVQETAKPEGETFETCEDKESVGKETKEQDSYRPGEEKIQELSEEKMKLSRKVEEEEKVAEKKKELGDDDMSRKVRDIEQRGSDAMKGQEERDKIQELVLEDKASDGSKRILAEATAENDKSRKVQENDKQQPHEEGKHENQLQKVTGGEISGHGEVEDVENEKKTTDSAKEAQATERAESDVSGKCDKGDLIQELKENRTSNQNEQEEEKEDEADGPEKAIGTIEQELVNQKSQVKQDNVEDGEETRKMVEDKTKEEESETKTDDVVRKVQGIKEHELFEPKRDHVSKIKEVVEEKVAESEIESECGGLSKAHGSEEHKIHKPDIHKENSKTKRNGTDEPSGQEKEEDKKENTIEYMIITEKGNSTNVQEIKEERPDKPESHEKRYKNQELVEAEHNDHKEEQKDEKIILKAKRETEEDSSKNVQEIEKQESDGLKRSTVQSNKQETEDKEITRGMKEKKIVERREKTEDGRLRKVQDDANLELSKPYKRQEEDKVHEPVETGTSDYREEVKKQDGDDILRSQETAKPVLDELELQRNVPQLVDEEKLDNIAKPGGRLEEDDSSKFHEFEERRSYEDWTHDEREKIKDLVKDEATDPKDNHTGEAGHNDHREEQEEKGISKAGLKAEEDSLENVQEFDELQRSSVQDKSQEIEERDKTRAMEEKESVERRTKTKDGSLRKVLEGEDEDPELDRHKTYEEEDMMAELVEAETSDHKEKVKTKDRDGILRSQETGKLDLGELERDFKQRKIHQPVKDEKGAGTMENSSEPGGTKEGDSSGKFHEFRKQKSYEDLVKEEANYLKDKHTGGKGEHEEERYEKVPQAKTKVEDEVNKKVGESKKEEENLVDDSTTKIQEIEKEESHESKIHEKLDIIQDFGEDKTGDQENERTGEAVLVANNEKDSSRKLDAIEGEQDEIPKTSDRKVKEEDGERFAEKETKEQEAQVQELEGKTENFKDDDIEASRGEKGKQGKTIETKSDNGTVGMIRETELQESNETKNQEPEENIEELVTEDDSLRKGQEFLENKSPNVPKRRPVEQEEIQKLKEVENRKDEVKSVVETKTNAGKSRKREMRELDESGENEELKKIRQQMEEKTSAPKNEKEKEGSEKIAEVKMQDKIDIKMKDQDTKRQEPYEHEEHDKIPEPSVEGTKYQKEEEKRMADRETEEMKKKLEDVSSRTVQKIKAEESDGLPYELLENEDHDKIPESNVEGTKYQIEEEKRMADRETEKMRRKYEDLSSGKVQNIKAEESEGMEKHMKLSKIQENQSVEEKIQEHGEEEVNDMGGYKAVLKTKSMEDSSHSQDVEEKGSDQTEQENIQGLMVEDEGKEQYDIREGEQDEKAKIIQQVESNANDDNSKKNVTERLSGKKQNEDHQELVEMQKNDQGEEVREEKILVKGEKIDHEYKIQEHEEGNSDQLERHGEEERIGSLAEEETSNDKEENRGNRARTERKIRDDGLEEKELAMVLRIREQDKKTSLAEKDTTGETKENKNHETNSRDDSSRKTQENEKQESREQQRNYEEQNKKNLEPREDGKEDKEIAEAEGPRELKGIENQDNINELVEEKTNNQEGEDKRSMSMEVLAKSEDHESEGHERLRKQDKSMEVSQQRLRDNLEDEETEKTETKTNDKESRKIHQIKAKETGEEERRKGQGRTKELVEDRTPEIDIEELTEPVRDEKLDEIEEPVDKETSEDEEEELEVEVEDSEEDWEAEVVQEMDSDEENDNIRNIRRIKLGFRLVGGSTLFMSLIVIVISIIRSKRKIRCYKF